MNGAEVADYSSFHVRHSTLYRDSLQFMYSYMARVWGSEGNAVEEEEKDKEENH